MTLSIDDVVAIAEQVNQLTRSHRRHEVTDAACYRLRGCSGS
jgi:hypothetical protein